MRAIRSNPTIVEDFAPYLTSACKIVGASADAALLQRCEAAMQGAVGAQATAVRSQSYYLDVTPPGHDKGTFVETMARRLGIPTDAVATIGDMQNDLPMFATSGLSFAMGNATDDVKSRATHVTASNEDDGFAKAIEFVLNQIPAAALAEASPSDDRRLELNRSPTSGHHPVHDQDDDRADHRADQTGAFTGADTIPSPARETSPRRRRRSRESW